MKDVDFLSEINKLCNRDTVYMLGTYCNVVTDSIIKSKTKQLPSWYTQNRVNSFKRLIGKGYIACDCIGMIKGILWGYNGTSVPKYASNDVPDTNADGMYKLCKNKSSDMNNIPIGSYMYFKGHAGIYMGEINGVRSVAESAPSKGKVSINPLYYQNWTNHGWLPFIEKTEEDKFDNKEWIKDIQKEIEVSVDGIVGTKTLSASPVIKLGDRGEVVRLIQVKLNELGYNCGKADGICGKNTVNAIKEFQEDKEILGVIRNDTWVELYK